VTPGSDAWLATHGIDPMVWNAREVWRYGEGDAATVWAAVSRFLPSSKKGTITRWVNQTGGLVMPKTAVPGGPDIAPQLRPDNPITTDLRPGPYTFHGELGDEWPTTPNGKPLLRQHVWEPDRQETLRHIAKHHGGVNTSEVHRHGKGDGKYVFLPGAKEARIDLHPFARALLPTARRVFFVLEGALKNDAVLSAGETVFSVPSVTLWRRRTEVVPSELIAFARQHLGDKMVFVIPDADWAENDAVRWQAHLVREYLREVLGDTAVHIAAPPLSFFKDTREKGVDDWLGTPGQAWARENGHVPGIDGLEIFGKEITRPRPRGFGSFADAVRGDIRMWPREEAHALTMLSLLGPQHRRSLAGLASVMDVSGSGHDERALRVLQRLVERQAIAVNGSLAVEETVKKYTQTKRRPKKRGSGYVFEKVAAGEVRVLDWVAPERGQEEYIPPGNARDKATRFWQKNTTKKEARPVINVHDDYTAFERQRAPLGEFWAREAYALEQENARKIRQLEQWLEAREGGDDDHRLRPHLRRVQ
jgi:hypothetical protein